MTDVIDLDKTRRTAGQNKPSETKDGEVLDAVVVYHPTADPDALPTRPAEPIRLAFKGGEAKPTDSADTAPEDAAEDSEADGGVVLVDAKVGPAGEVKVPVRERPRREVIPAWVRDRQQIADVAKWTAGYYAHLAAFHTVRLPQYWWRLAMRSPIGLARIVAAVAGWVIEADLRETRRGLVKAADPNAYLRVRQEHRSAMGQRAGLAGLGLLVVVLAAFLVGQANMATQWVAVAATLAGLGWAGQAEGGRIADRATDGHVMPRLSADLIIEALATLGLAELNKALAKNPDAVKFPAVIMRDGAGWRADIDLPSGVTAAEVIGRRDKLASGLRRPVGCVWPEADAETHSGRLVLWVGDKTMAKTRPTPWPLADRGRVNLLEPIVIGTDQRGRPVTVTLMFVAVLIGAVPRMGKTFLMRLLLLAASLDVRTEIHVYNLKGGPDLAALGKVAHAYRSGDSDENIEYLLRDARAVRQDMRRRYDTLDTLPRDVCPESKITDALASNRALGLHPVVFAVDECQVMFEHGKHGKDLEDIVTDLVKRGPAVGIIVMLSTQRVDAKSIPTGISANAVLRYCLKVTGQTENDMVLGTSMYKAGVRATMFGRNDLGIAYLVGEGNDPVIVRTSYIDALDAEAIAVRARADRVAANRLTGQAADEDAVPDDATATVLDHLLEIWPPNDSGAGGLADKAWCDDLAARLVAAHPATYDGWEGPQVTSAVAPHGLTTIQVKRTPPGSTKPVNRRGLSRADVLAANTNRDANRDQEAPTDQPQ